MKTKELNAIELHKEKIAVNKKDLLKPSEILAIRPELDISARFIGYMFQVGLLVGFKTEQGCLVTIESFDRAVLFLKSVKRAESCIF